MLSISSLSNEYVRVQIQATSAGSAVDPTADAVQLAFVLEGTTPVSGDWKAGTWEIDATTTPTTDYARALVGSAGVITLAAGTYDVFVKVSDNPEVPVKKAGPMRVI
jgi:hypothetical protein